MSSISFGRSISWNFKNQRPMMLLIALGAAASLLLEASGGTDFNYLPVILIDYVIIAFVTWVLARELDPLHNLTALIPIVLIAFAPATVWSGAFVFLALIISMRLITNITGYPTNRTDVVMMVIVWLLAGISVVSFNLVPPLFTTDELIFAVGGMMGMGLGTWIGSRDMVRTDDDLNTVSPKRLKLARFIAFVVVINGYLLSWPGSEILLMLGWVFGIVRIVDFVLSKVRVTVTD